MNPISFACSHCSRPITVAPEVAGRAVPCPHCTQATLVPTPVPTPLKTRLGIEGDQGPDFSETLRKAREATDSIFHDHDEEGDSLFGGSDTPRKLFVPPPVAVASWTPTASSDSSQATMRVPGLSNLPPIASGNATPIASRAVFVPSPSGTFAAPPANPFEDLLADSSPEASGNLQESGAMVEGEKPDEDETVGRVFPWKDAIIAALTVYAVVATAFAAWGWLRTFGKP